MNTRLGGIALGTAVSGSMNTAVGYQAATSTYQFSPQPMQPQWQFTLVKNQNGFVLHFGDKSWICKDMEEVQQNFMVALVEQRIEQ
jgi:hypothetical protein